MHKKLKRRTMAAGALLALVILICLVAGSSSAFAANQVWSFGVMGDTQWTTTDPAGQNPNMVAVSIVDQINQQFVKKGVKFVIQVGDLTENGANADIAVRASAAQVLYSHGIGFFPMRGNHEYKTGASNNYGITQFLSSFPQTQGLSRTFGARNFSSPVLAGSYPNDLQGLSYSFDYGTPGSDARFVIIDDWVTPNQFTSAAGYSYGYSIADQQSWISSRLDETTRNTEHAFVLSHQNLMGENHTDCLFTGYTNANPAMQNAFFASLASNGVGYYISGHDHMDQRSIIASPDGLSSVEELICASNSSKFYTPKSTSDGNWFGQKTRETPVQQELQTVGFYIFTVDGPRVTVDYYADDHGGWLSDDSYPLGPTNNGTRITPTFHFVKRATWGYSTNGQEFLVGGPGAANGTSYTKVQDSHRATSAQILSGTYANTLTDYNARTLTQTVDTGWFTPSASSMAGLFRSFASDGFTIWGMAPLGAVRNAIDAAQTAPYTLSLSYNPALALNINAGSFGITARNSKGVWVNAVDFNIGGTKRFVLGPWNASYGLGTYGVDPATRTAWAVLNYDSDFAVANGISGR